MTDMKRNAAGHPANTNGASGNPATEWKFPPPIPELAGHPEFATHPEFTAHSGPPTHSEFAAPSGLAAHPAGVSAHPELVEGRANGAHAAMPGIRAAGVFAAYGEREVLSGLELEVAQGTVMALAGPNGVGKSTLLRAIAGALRPSRGEIRVMGADVYTMGGKERARLVGMVPQNPELPRGASALEVTLMGRNPHLGLLAWESANDVEIAIEALRLTDAAHLMDRPVHQLSGGERQRVAIAMALAQQTPVILLDEPTANLDLAYQPAIMRLLRELAAAGKTLVTAVHDLTLAGQFCDSVALVSDGRVVASGPPETTITPAAIRQVYGAETLVLPHPETGKPIVVSR